MPLLSHPPKYRSTLSTPHSLMAAQCIPNKKPFLSPTGLKETRVPQLWPRNTTCLHLHYFPMLVRNTKDKTRSSLHGNLVTFPTEIKAKLMCVAVQLLLHLTLLRYLHNVVTLAAGNWWILHQCNRPIITIICLCLQRHMSGRHHV